MRCKAFTFNHPTVSQTLFSDALGQSQHFCNSEWIPDFEFHDPELIRQVSYGDPGMQLSMIYNDIKNGTLDQTGEFFNHIKKVKEECPPVQYEEVEVLDETN